MSTTQTISTETLYHPFEKLAQPPYRYIGHTHEIYQAIPGDPSCPIQPGTCCDYCGTGISEVHRFRGSDGRIFKVGSDCVRKGCQNPKDRAFV